MEKFFLAYDDPKLEQNFLSASTKIHDLQKIVSTESIAASHTRCGQLSLTDQFMVMDADCVLLDTFNIFEVYKDTMDKNFMYIFSARNPVNGLEYGHGAIKIFQRNFFKDEQVVDFSTSFYGKIKHIKKTLNIHKFNSSPFHAWRTAFRECVKISSGTIKNRNIVEDEYRLTTWCEVFDNVEYVEYVKSGALEGRKYGYANKDNTTELMKINDFKWLKDQYEQVVSRTT